MRVLLRRHGDGIGDWLFMLTCMKHVNQQHPDVEFHVDFNLESRKGRARALSPLVREAFERSDVRFTTLDDTVEWPRSAFDLIVPHVVYGMTQRSLELTYVESMLETFTSLLGRALHYDRSLVPRFVYPEFRARPRGYVALVSKGKRETAHKDWPPHHFDDLAGDLYHRGGRAILHVGRNGDWILRKAPVERYFDTSFEMLAGILAGADLFIGLENGISVLASMLGTKTIVIYQKATWERFGLNTVARMVRPHWNEVAAIAMKELTC